MLKLARGHTVAVDENLGFGTWLPPFSLDTDLLGADYEVDGGCVVFLR